MTHSSAIPGNSSGSSGSPDDSTVDLEVDFNGKPIWETPDLKSPHTRSDKADAVQKMFSAIAPSYDLNNRVHSFGRDQAWRKYAVKAAGAKPGDTIIDIACGTGDLTEAFAQSPSTKVIGIDFTPAMLDVARAKLRKRPPQMIRRVEYREGDAMSLAVDSGTANVVSIAFGIRNVSEPAKAIGEFFRILKPGGRLVILEFDRPRVAPMSWAYDFYCGWLMPRTATLLSRDKSGAYRYLPASVGTFMTRDEMKATLAAAGFTNISAKPLTFGICICYRAEKK